MTKHTNPKDIIRKAHDLIEQYGWIQGHYEYYPPRGGARYCSIGALRKATEALGESYHEYPYYAAVEMLFDASGMVNPNASEYLKESDIITWNDVQGRTEEQVLTAFEKAAQ